MALSQEQLNQIKSNYNTGNKVERLGRLTLGNFLAKYAGKAPVFDEFTNRDQVQFTFYWTNYNFMQFMDLLSKNPKIDKKIAKALADNLFRYSNKGEQLIYANRRYPLPEVVTYDNSSSYALVVDLLHAEGTDKQTGQHFNKYYTKVLNVMAQRDEHNAYLTFSENDIKKIEHPQDETPKAELDNKGF